MDKIIDNAGRMVNKFTKFTLDLGPEAWGTIAVLTVVFGFLMLRGNMLSK